jgi:hypothetical protein
MLEYEPHPTLPRGYIPHRSRVDHDVAGIDETSQASTLPRPGTPIFGPRGFTGTVTSSHCRHATVAPTGGGAPGILIPRSRSTGTLFLAGEATRNCNHAPVAGPWSARMSHRCLAPLSLKSVPNNVQNDRTKIRTAAHTFQATPSGGGIHSPDRRQLQNRAGSETTTAEQNSKSP